MYESFHGLKEKPFNITPDPDYFYMSQAHENAYMHLQYALDENKGLVVVTGEIGAGKTTLIHVLLKKIQQYVHVGVITHANMESEEFIKMVCQELELETGGMGKAGMLDALHEFLLGKFSQKERVVLIVDEAQNLPVETIEEIRMLSNLETEKYHLVQIILAGQPELRSKLQQKELRQFTERILVFAHLRALDRHEVGQYVRHRLTVAGAENPDLFNEDALSAIYQHARGIPRMINILCDAALLYGFADGITTMDSKVIEEVVKERQTAGFFTASKDDQGAVPPSGSAESWQERLDSLERKINLLGKAVVHLNRTMTVWSNKRAERDKVMLQLLKLLQQSMDRRKSMLGKYKELREKARADVERSSQPRPAVLKRQG